MRSCIPGSGMVFQDNPSAPRFADWRSRSPWRSAASSRKFSPKSSYSLSRTGTTSFVRGRSHVEWTVVENAKPEKFSNSGTFLTLMRKLPNGIWKMTHQMWDDPPNLKQ